MSWNTIKALPLAAIGFMPLSSSGGTEVAAKTSFNPQGLEQPVMTQDSLSSKDVGVLTDHIIAETKANPKPMVTRLEGLEQRYDFIKNNKSVHVVSFKQDKMNAPLDSITAQAIQNSKQSIMFSTDDHPDVSYVMTVKNAKQILQLNQKTYQKLGIPEAKLHISGYLDEGTHATTHFSQEGAIQKQYTLSSLAQLTMPRDGLEWMFLHEGAHHLNSHKNLVPGSRAKLDPGGAPHAVRRSEEFFADSVANAHASNKMSAFIALGHQLCDDPTRLKMGTPEARNSIMQNMVQNARECEDPFSSHPSISQRLVNSFKQAQTK